MRYDIFPIGRWMALTDGHGNIISKMYDWISPFMEGRFRAVRNDGRYGILRLVGDKVYEILPPKAIYPPSLKDLFMVEMTKVRLEKEKVLLIDERGNCLQECIDSWILSKELVVVEKTPNRFFLYNPTNGKEAGEFTDIEIYDDYIETQENDKRGLITKDFIEIFKPEFKAVQKFGSRCFMAIKEDETRVLGTSEWSVEAEEFMPESNGYVCMRSKTRYGFVNIETGKRTQFIFPAAKSYMENGYAKVTHPLLGLCWMDKEFNCLQAREEE